jgi:hypothetical protein
MSRHMWLLDADPEIVFLRVWMLAIALCGAIGAAWAIVFGL